MLVEWLLSVAFTWILAEPLLIILMTVSPFVAGDFFAKACTRSAEIRPRYVKILAVRMPPYLSADLPTGHRRRARASAACACCLFCYETLGVDVAFWGSLFL